VTQNPWTPSAVLFDLDGTLIDTYHLYLESYRRALEPVIGRAIGPEDVAEQRPSSERHFLEDWLGAEQAAACHASMLEHYRVLHGAMCEGIYDGVREMLAALRAAGIPLGIVTGKGRAAWEITARSLDLGRFEVVVTEDDATEPKPHPGGLQKALAALGVEPAAAAYIGDSPGDLEAGRRAGMRVGGALWPKTAPGEPAQFRAAVARFEPDWHFERPADVTRAFARWC
jgi:pyrophosphatase PpaX